MIPSLVLIRTNTKQLITWTYKKNLIIGTHEDADIVINNPYFFSHTTVFGVDSINNKQSKINTTISWIFLVSNLALDDLSVRFIHCRFLINVLLTLLLTLASISLYNIYRGHSTIQDWSPLNLPAKGIYGFCRQDKNHPKGILFSFDAIESRNYRLHFVAGGKGDGTFIHFLLNGTSIAKPMRLPTGWGKETSIELPSSVIKNGENLLLVYPEGKTRKQSSWGISELRLISVGKSGFFSQQPNHFVIVSILEALNKENISAEELAQFHRTVSLWEQSKSSGEHSNKEHDLIKKIEKRMEKILYGVAFDVRAKRIQGDDSTVRQLLNDTSNWIPESWGKGREIYDEFCR